MNRLLLKYIFFVLIFLPGCLPDKDVQEKMKWRLNPEDNKLPYGTYLAFQSLKYYFPDAAIVALPRSFKYTNMDNKMKYNYTGHSLLILEGLDFYISDEEWKELKSFIDNGNEVMLFCSRMDSKIEEELQCDKESGDEEHTIYYSSSPLYDDTDSLTLARTSQNKYGYKGRPIRGYFSFPDASMKAQTGPVAENTDTAGSKWSAPEVLGYSSINPDFIRYKLGEGHLSLHAAPLVLSNYFLLQNGNENYLTAIWQTLPANINQVYWNDYFKRTGESSGLGMLFRHPATKLAIFLCLITLLIYVLFEGKRKQRIIPVVEPLKNDSVSFVETVGRLYYNKGNHTNLAGKLTQHFLDWVRTHYFLNTNLLNEDFTRQLAIKSGLPDSTIHGLMDMIHEIKLSTAYIDDAYLYQLYNTIQLFYKNNRK